MAAITMLDTINLVLWDLEKHDELLRFLHRSDLNEGVSKFIKILSPDQELDIIQKVRLQNRTRFHETGQEVETAYFAKLPSYHYDISYQIDLNKGCIRFNLSIPKYNYATNVFMLLPPVFSAEYEKRLSMNTRQLLYKSYDDLRFFIDNFFKVEFRGIPVDFSCLQISRLDMCFNYVMRSKEDALYVINHLKKQKKKYYQEGKGTRGKFDTGIYYPGKSFTFKIYHKGSEFRRHDKKHLEEKNKRGKPLYAIKEIEALADRTVRYELEIKNRGFNELMKSKVFRKDDPFYKSCKKAYFKFKNGSKFKSSDGDIDYAQLSRKWKRRINFVKTIMNKSFRFFYWGNTSWSADSKMDKGLVDNIYEDGYYLELDQGYSYELHKACADRFFEEIERFKPKMINDIYAIIRDFRSDKKRDDSLKQVAAQKVETEGLSESRLKLLLELLEKYNFDEIQNLGFVNERTIRRYLNYLKKHGITRTSRIGGQIEPMPNNLWKYDNFIKLNFVKLRSSLDFRIKAN